MLDEDPRASRSRSRTKPRQRLRRQAVERLHRQLEVLGLRVLELRVREPAQALDEDHHGRHAGARDLGGVVQRAPTAAGARCRRPRGSTRRRSSISVSSKRIGSIDQIGSHSTSMRSSAANRSDASFAAASIEARALRRRGGAGRAAARPSRRPTSRSPAGRRRRPRCRPRRRRPRPRSADVERQLRGAGERVAALVHRRRAGVRRLAAPRDARALDAERAEHDAERQIHRLEHRALLDVQLEVGAGAFELRARLERAVEVDAVLARGRPGARPRRGRSASAARPGRASSRPPPTSRRASGRSARPPRRPS